MNIITAENYNSFIDAKVIDGGGNREPDLEKKKFKEKINKRHNKNFEFRNIW